MSGGGVNRISGNERIDVWNASFDDDSSPESAVLSQVFDEGAQKNSGADAEVAAGSKLYDGNAGAEFRRRQIQSQYVEARTVPAGGADLEQRAAKLAEIFSGGGMRNYDTVAPLIGGLSADDAKKLVQVYGAKTGRDLRMDAANYLFMKDRLSAFKILAPERVHSQEDSQGVGSGGGGIKSDPVLKEIPLGSRVEYALDLSGEAGGNRKVTHLISENGAAVEKDGQSLEGAFDETGTRLIAFEVRYGNGLPEFYTQTVNAVPAETAAANELANLPGTAPDSEIYLAYLDGQVDGIKGGIARLESREAELAGRVSNRLPEGATDAERATRNREIIELGEVRSALKGLRDKLPAAEAARAEVASAFAGGQGKLVPLKAVLTAKENGQSIPLQLYAKNLGGGKWAIVDVTNPAAPRTWTGEGLLPADALNQAWDKFVGGTNDLPAGRIAAAVPENLGFQPGKSWNSESRGASALKDWSNKLGIGSLALAGLGVASAFGPGTQGATVPLLLASGVFGGLSAGTSAADRYDNGSFEWKSSETALDMLGIVGGIASLGGLGAMTGAGRTILANGAKYSVQTLGNFSRIAQIAENGTNAAGAILIANQYVSAMEEVSRSSMTPDQKAAATRNILAQAVATGGMVAVGVGISTRLARVEQSANKAAVENWLGRKVKVGDPLPDGYHWQNGQIFRNPNKVDANFLPLKYEAGTIAPREGTDRLSKPPVMNRNFELKTKEELRIKNPTFTKAQIDAAFQTEKARVQIHHLIPDELVQSTELGKAAQKAGYDLDGTGNLKGMPRQPGDRIDDLDIEHRGSHPQYTLRVQSRMEQIERELIKRYKSLDKVPPRIIRRKMKEAEDEFRRLIETNQAPMRDGKLAFLVPQPLILGGRYEIRV